MKVKLYNGSIHHKLYGRLMTFEKKGLIKFAFEPGYFLRITITEGDNEMVTKKLSTLRVHLAKRYLLKELPILWFGINEIVELDRKIDRIDTTELSVLTSYLISKMEVLKLISLFSIPLSILIIPINIYGEDYFKIGELFSFVFILYFLLGFYTAKSIRAISIYSAIESRIKDKIEQRKSELL